MKTIKYIIPLLAAFACSKEVSSELPAPGDGDELITIKATHSSSSPAIDATKASPRQGFSWYWSANDQITVTTAQDAQTYTIKDGFSPKYAEFVGKAVNGDVFTILYPGDQAATADWKNQTQTGNNSFAHLQYAASLNDVDEYLTFSFSPEWATAHGGTIKQTGVLKMVIALPDTITTVKGITLTAEDAIFYPTNGDTKSNKLDITLVDAAPEGNVITAWMTTSWNEAVVPAGATIAITVKNQGNSIEKEVTFTNESTLMGGMVNSFTVDATGWVYPSHYTSGKGTEAKPWVITTPDEMLYMADDLAAGEIRYFKLGADIDMNGIDWTPLNATSPYDKQINFDGDGHTISNFSCSAASYPSFFGVLYGVCKNVKFTNASITASAKGCGILGGYGGTSGKPCEVKNVHVQGTISGLNNTGGFFGTARECTITACSADVTITSTGQMVGGLFGADAGLGVTVRDCWTSGSITSTASVAGGICGDLVGSGNSIYNSYSTASVTTQFLFGGLVGRAVAGQKSNATNCTGQDPKNHIEKCIAWNDFLKSDYVTDAAEHFSSGTIIGATAVKNYLVGCIRKNDISFTDCPGNAATGNYLPFDQEDSDPDNILVKGTGTYAFSYHGKASAAGKTLSEVAQELGWSTEVWDFSAATPKLK